MFPIIKVKTFLPVIVVNVLWISTIELNTTFKAGEMFDQILQQFICHQIRLHQQKKVYTKFVVKLNLFSDHSLTSIYSTTKETHQSLLRAIMEVRIKK